ncbi:MAG: flagellar brake protein [Velocimicrobium sp.]
MSTIIMPGTKLDLIQLKNGFGEVREGKQYNSKVLDLMDDETVKISVPMEGGRIVPLEVGDKYQCVFYTKRGLYHCKGEILERYKEGLISVLVVYFETDLEKFQRRKYYRLECAMDIQYRVISDEEVSAMRKLKEKKYKSDEEKESIEQFIKEAQAQWKVVPIVDISGGGCRFQSKFEYQAGTNMVLQLNYSYRGKEIRGQYDAKLIVSIPMQRRKGYFEHRIEFLDIRSAERESLIKFIFEQERKIRQRERGLAK